MAEIALCRIEKEVLRARLYAFLDKALRRAPKPPFNLLDYIPPSRKSGT